MQPIRRTQGLRRSIRWSREDPKAAEVAFTVIDACQHRGLGTILLAVLYVTAEARGVQVLRAIILSENTKVSNSVALALRNHAAAATIDLI